MVQDSLYLSQKVIEIDNPTNLGLSDFSLVATTLDTNNKIVVVLKPLVIDLELLIDIDQDNKAQAIERCAA
jgi:hypothetical protein